MMPSKIIYSILGVLLFSCPSMAQCDSILLNSDKTELRKVTDQLNTLVIPHYNLKKNFGGQKPDADPDLMVAFQDLEDVIYLKRHFGFLNDSPATIEARKIVDHYYFQLLAQYWKTSPFASEIDLQIATTPAMGQKNSKTFNSILPGQLGIVFQLSTPTPQTPFGQHLLKIKQELNYPVIFVPGQALMGQGNNATFYEGGPSTLPHFYVGPKTLQDIILAPNLTAIEQHPVWAHEIFHGRHFKNQQAGKYTVLAGAVRDYWSNDQLSFHFDENYGELITIKYLLVQLQDLIDHQDLAPAQKNIALKKLIYEISRELSLTAHYLQRSLRANTMAIEALPGTIHPLESSVAYQGIEEDPSDPQRIIYYFSQAFITAKNTPGLVIYSYFLPRPLFAEAWPQEVYSAQVNNVLQEILWQQHSYFKSLGFTMTDFANAWMDLIEAGIKDDILFDATFLAKLRDVKLPAGIKLPYLQLSPAPAPTTSHKKSNIMQKIRNIFSSSAITPLAITIDANTYDLLNRELGTINRLLRLKATLERE